MFRSSSGQRTLFGAEFVLPERIRKGCEEGWPALFRAKALPMLRGMEKEFADLFHEEIGRPNRPVELVVGVLILKEMYDMTDEEALDALRFDARWWYAFDRDLEELHLCQKTLHNFRVGLLESEKAKLPFRQLTDGLVKALGIKVGRQRLDSTHVLSNFAILTRLGLFCETIRVFLRALEEVDGQTYKALPVGVLRRHGEENRYRDAKKEVRQRRLDVVARDIWRLVNRFENHPQANKLDEWACLKRLFDEQIEVVDKVQEPKEGDDDHGDGDAPVQVRDPKKISSASLQTPHDQDVTYSGHKGKGYSVQVMETCAEENVVEIITEVEVTPAHESDQKAIVPLLDVVIEAGHQPEEIVADTTYSGAKNASELAKCDVNLTAPAPARGKPDPEKKYEAPADKCPQEVKKAGEWLKQQEASEDFKGKYDIRAGIEATNSELKRKHGLGKLRVRGGKRVELSVYFKTVACNLKRAFRYWRECIKQPGGAACLG